MAIIARPGPVFYVFGPKISRTFWGKCTEQSSRKKLAVGGFEPEKVRLLYPAPLKASLLSTTIKVRFLQYFRQNERKSSKRRVIQGLGVVIVTVSWQCIGNLKIRGAAVVVFVPGADHIRGKSLLCRSEERRVGKECRSRWSPYH